jgi:hypothetical protein
VTSLLRSIRSTSRHHYLGFVAVVGISAIALLDCGGSHDTSAPSIPGKGGARGAAAGASGAAGGAAAGASGAAGGAAAGASGAAPITPYQGTAGTLVTIQPAWDWNGVVGTGQSLAVGTTPITSTTQPFNNLMLSLGSATVPPWDPSLAELTMVPLIERKTNTTYPAPYPLNLWGETPHSAMANQLTAMVRYASGHDFISVHSIVGESGQGIVALEKITGDTTGTTGRAYAATLFEASAITRLAQAAGKTYGIGAIVMTHGETDSGSPSYDADLIQLLKDYNTDLLPITGQTTPIPMFLSQQFAYPNSAGQRPAANQIQWQLGVKKPGEFVCTGPKYQYPGHGDGIHLSATGYQQLGEKNAQVYYERVLLGNDWQPLYPTGVTRDGRVVTVTFHVPVPPLAWDENLPAPTNDWPNAKGFELRRGGLSLAIESVVIDGDAVKITCASDLGANIAVAYALTAGSSQMTVASNSMRWGQLRDSDPFVGWTTRTVQPNYAVAFELPVP